MEKHLGITDQHDQYGFYGVTLPSAWQVWKHLREANLIVKCIEAVKANDIVHRHSYAIMLKHLDSPGLAEQMANRLKVARATAARFGAVTVVSLIAERKGMLTRFFKRGTSSGAAPSKC